MIITNKSIHLTGKYIDVLDSSSHESNLIQSVIDPRLSYQVAMNNHLNSSFEFGSSMSFYARFLLERIYPEEKELGVLCKHLPVPFPHSSLHSVYSLL